MKNIVLCIMIVLMATPMFAQDQPQIPEEFNWLVAVVAFLFFLSEALAQIPSIKSNSVFQLIAGILKKLKDAFGEQKGPSDGGKPV